MPDGYAPNAWTAPVSITKTGVFSFLGITLSSFSMSFLLSEVAEANPMWYYFNNTTSRDLHFLL